MVATCKGRGQERIQDHGGMVRRRKPSTHAQDVGIVMLAGEGCQLGIVDQCRSDTSMFVGRHAHPDARAA